MPLRLLVDENIPFAREAFGPLGDVALMPGRAIAREHLRDRDALVVRSVTEVDAALIDGTPVKFVGSATTGSEHVDVDALRDLGVEVSIAEGCNARSVVQWVAAALAELILPERDWAGLTLGVVGRGRIGAQVEAMARRLGMRTLACDPPLARAGARGRFVPLDELLAESDVVTLHVPMIRDGVDKTLGLIGARELSLLKRGALLLNAARGGALDNAAALAWREAGGGRLALDVFEGEPSPNRSLVAACAIATPHVAGYSAARGKVNGTRMMADALRARFAPEAAAWVPALPPPPNALVRVDPDADWREQVREAIRASYDIRADDAALQGGLELEGSAWGKHFDALRRDYPERREFEAFRASTAGLKADAEEALRAVGFGLA
jgi:erythronate-4-phosphate dehydrogenase